VIRKPKDVEFERLCDQFDLHLAEAIAGSGETSYDVLRTVLLKTLSDLNREEMKQRNR